MILASEHSSSVASGFGATRERIVLPTGMSYLVRRDDYPNPICIWNYHPEWEIHFIPEAQGFAYVGDYIGPFRPGHLVLIGTNLPHNWISPGAPLLPGRDLVLQFDADALLSIRSICAEFEVLHRLKGPSQRGIEIVGADAEMIGNKILRLHNDEGVGQLGLFLEILNDIDTSNNIRLLASEHFVACYTEVSRSRHRRIDQAIQVLQSTPELSMSEVARAVGMESSAFSRAFRRRTGSNFSSYSRSIRTWRARMLLAETDVSVTDVCFASGFNNLSNFNRYFRQETGLTPRAYRLSARIRNRSMVGVGQIDI